MKTLRDYEEELSRLQSCIREETDLLATLTADVARVEAATRAHRMPVIGRTYVVGLIVSVPVWLLVTSLCWWVVR